MFFKSTLILYILFVVFLSAQINLFCYPSLPKSTVCGIPQCPNLPFVVFLSAQITFCGTPQCANLPFVVFLSTQIYLLWYSPVPKNPSENIGCSTLSVWNFTVRWGYFYRLWTHIYRCPKYQKVWKIPFAWFLLPKCTAELNFYYPNVPLSYFWSTTKTFRQS